MAIRLATNISSINARRHLGERSEDFTRSIERVSSGLRINRGADDAAGLSVSQGMRSEIRAITEGARNAESGMNLIQQAEGALNEVSSILLRMRDLAVSSANDTLNDGNRDGFQAEFNQLSAEIDRLVLSTSYNEQALLTGFGNTVSQNSEISTALDGFSGLRDIGISGAMPGTYVFSDSSAEDNQIRLSVGFPDGTEHSQTLDVGTILDRQNGKNLVATGTTFVANFDRLGISVTLMGDGVDTNGAMKTTVSNGGEGGLLVIAGESVNIGANATLESIANKINDVLLTTDPAGSARYNTELNEVQIDARGIELLESPGGFLGLSDANVYIDGRLDGKRIVISEGEGGVFQVGSSNDRNDRISVNMGDMRTSGGILNIAGLSISNLGSSRSSITRLDSAIYNVARQRGHLGAIQNRLEYTTVNLGSTIENISAAESVIRDADLAEEVSELTRNQILSQAAQSMIAQANSLPQTALQLLNN